ncbi:MAG: PAS domain S-box protein [Alphaproteobacteria bacterium]
MMDHRRPVLILVAIMIAVALIIGGTALGSLYRTAFEQQRAKLVQTTNSQARLIEAIARFDQAYNRDYPEGALAATIAQIRDAYERYKGFDETGEFTLARRDGDRIVFILHHSRGGLVKPEPVPWRSKLAEPMRRALSGQSGAMIGLDYRGAAVLAAYEPVAVLNLGFVAKIDVAEIRAPFLVAGGIVSLIAVALIAVGSALFFRIGNPIVRRLQESEAQFRDLIEGSIQGVLIHRDCKPLFVNRAWANIFGYDDPAEILAMDSFVPLIAPEERDRLLQIKDARLGGEEAPARYVFRGLRRDGVPIWLDNTGRVVSWNGEEALQSVMVDITERKRAEDQLRSYFELPLMGMAISSPEMKWLSVNDKLCDMLGYVREELLQLNWADVTHPDDRAENLDRFERALAGEIDTYSLDKRYVRRDGSVFDALLSVQCVRTPEGAADYFVGIILDITQRKQAEQALRENDERLRRAQQIARIGDFVWDEKANRIAARSPVVRKIYGVPEDAEPETHDELLAIVHPDDRDRVRRVFSETPGSGKPYDIEFRIVRTDGEVRVVHELSEPVFDENGEHVRSVGTVQDVTEQRNLEDQLRHARKMEAVGQLTSGVAHDFTNLSQAILWNLEHLDQTVGPDPGPREVIANVIETTRRATAISQRLLAFARKQPLDPRPTNVNALVVGMRQLMQHSLGEIIELRTELADDLWWTIVDPAQLESALLNLVVNARHAMAGGGVLKVTTANATFDEDQALRHVGLEAGAYVALAVRDAGTGMPPEVAERAFEPYFTTKEVGEGSGLGLSSVYGFVKQSGGHVELDSAPGTGTTVTMYLPRTGKAAAGEAEEAAPECAPRRARETTVLVVEDDPDVRRAAVKTLGDIGFRVLSAPDGRAALALLDDGMAVDVLLTDVVMPGGMFGHEFARQAIRRRPGLKALLISGHDAATLKSEKADGEDFPLLRKPVRKRDLRDAIYRLIAEEGETR